MSSLHRLAERLERLERSQRAASTPQLAHSSVEGGGAIDVNDVDGQTVMQLGGQFDGTFVAATLVGPVPPVCVAPTVESVVGGLKVRWSGLFVDDALVPMDFSRVEIHVSTTANFDASTADTLYGTFETPRGAEVFLPLPPVAHYVKLVTRSLAGKASDASVEATGTPGAVVTDADLAATNQAVQQAQSDADAAATAASNAQTTADSATTAAAAAQTAADNAQTSANNAATAASTADSKAVAAQSAADAAQADADAAATAASNAQTTADSASTAAATADSKAVNAQSTADAANSAAATAQTAADNAQTTANAAQSAANAAQTSADNAQTTANAAQTAATNAQTSADNAATAASTADTKAVNAQAAADAAQADVDAVPAQISTAKQEAIDAGELYVKSRGADLVTNGTGYMGDNTNFSLFTFTKTDAPVGSSGSFVTPVGNNGTHNADELVPVDPGKGYSLSCYARQAAAGVTVDTRFYLGLAPYDAYGNLISPVNYMYRPGTTTTLAQPLNPGDTVVYLTSAANWMNTAGTATHWRTIVWWDYVDAGGKAWPVETYSRNYYGYDVYADGAIDFTANTITLRTAYNGPAKPAGTALSNGGSGGSYMYAVSNASVTQEWQQFKSPWNYKGVHTQTAAPGQNPSSATSAFPPGTGAVKIIFLPNRTLASPYKEPTSQHAFANISMSEAGASALIIDKWSYTGTTNINGGAIQADSITAGQIAANAIGASEIAANAVTAGAIAADAVVAGKIAADAVLADNIAANQITAGHMVAGTITAASGVIGSLDAATITVGQLVGSQIAAGTLTASHLTAGTITAASGVIGSIDAATITVGKITASQLATGTITAASGVIGSIDAATITVGKVTAAQMATGTITAASGVIGDIDAATITVGQLTGSQIAAGTLTASHLTAGTITAASGVIGSIDAATITVGKITASQMATGTITAASGVIGDIDAATITVGKITASQMATGTITAASGVIGDIDAATITVGKITAAQMATGTITAASGVIGSIDAAKITVGKITAAQMATGTITAVSGIIGDIDATVITTGTLDAGIVNVTNLNASNITTGTLSASRIDAASLVIGGSQIQGPVAEATTATSATSASSADTVTGSLGTAVVVPGGQVSGQVASAASADSATSAQTATDATNVTGSIGAGVAIPAAQLDAGTIPTTTTISGGSIKTGTIDASLVSVVNLDASNITTGTLSAVDISGVTITGSTISGGTVTGGSIYTAATGPRWEIFGSGNSTSSVYNVMAGYSDIAEEGSGPATISTFHDTTLRHTYGIELNTNTRADGVAGAYIRVEMADYSGLPLQNYSGAKPGGGSIYAYASDSIELKPDGQLLLDGSSIAIGSEVFGGAQNAHFKKIQKGDGETQGTNYGEVYRSASFTATGGAWTTIAWNAWGSAGPTGSGNVANDGTIYSSSHWRSAVAGFYSLTSAVTFSTAPTGYRALRVVTEGGTVLMRTGHDQASTPFRDLHLSANFALPGGGYGVRTEVYSNTTLTVAANVSDAPTFSHFVQVA